MKKTIILIGVLLVLTMNATAEIPRLINYQGRLTDDLGAAVPDEDYPMNFCIYGSEAGADTIWSSGVQIVAVANGTFTYILGSNVELPTIVFNTPERYLGTTIGSDAEISPRTRLTSNPYAYYATKADTAEFVLTAPGNFVETTGDTLTGGLVFDAAGTGIEGRFEVGETYSNILLYNEGSRKAALYGQGYGSLVLSDDAGINTVFLNARYNKGGSIQLRDNTGTDQFVFDAELTGDSAAVLPTGAISATEMYNEPGISESDGEGSVSGITFEYVVAEVDTITIPAPGYVVAIGGLTIVPGIPDSFSSAYCYVGIDTNYSANSNDSWKSLQIENNTSWGPNTPVTVFGSLYFDAAGTYVIKLYLADWDNSSSFSTLDAQIVSMYFPTAYGSVPSSVSQPMPEIPERGKLRANNLPEIITAQNTSIKDLELIAKQAKIEEQAARIRRLEVELELKKAKEQIE